MKINLLKRVRNNLYKHNTDIEEYRDWILNSLIFNEKARIVALFKDFLIYDELTEFLRR